jgi:hypothetical protein
MERDLERGGLYSMLLSFLTFVGGLTVNMLCFYSLPKRLMLTLNMTGYPVHMGYLGHTDTRVSGGWCLPSYARTRCARFFTCLASPTPSPRLSNTF